MVVNASYVAIYLQQMCSVYDGKSNGNSSSLHEPVTIKLVSSSVLSILELTALQKAHASSGISNMLQ